MTTQTEAERLADEISNNLSWVSNLKAAAELRRLVSFNQQLMDEVARLNKALAEQPATVQYQRREIGEGGWEDCTKEQYEYAERSPQMDTRVIPPTQPQPPAQREWVGLTADEMLEALTSVDPATQRLPVGFSRFACAIEAKLKEKNT